ncbi:cell wall-active antibiotics response protein LiaF [Numidum massiliense]|uniref:cell wall-active antibiotics response protein LiaF n=1 Tax=Numidum massiliense TaxID=1522315 RepID=UPI0006D55590|nr:cell wall-active antibiotics response protein LiaF [Numidum massiliense]
MKNSRISTYFLGIVLIGVGAAVLLKNLGIIDLHISSFIAPAILLYFGLKLLDQGQSTGGGVCLLIGIGLLLRVFGIHIGSIFGFALSLAIIYFGYRMIRTKKTKLTVSPKEQDDSTSGDTTDGERPWEDDLLWEELSGERAKGSDHREAGSGDTDDRDDRDHRDRGNNGDPSGGNNGKYGNDHSYTTDGQYYKSFTDNIKDFSKDIRRDIEENIRPEELKQTLKQGVEQLKKNFGATFGNRYETPNDNRRDEPFDEERRGEQFSDAAEGERQFYRDSVDDANRRDYRRDERGGRAEFDGDANGEYRGAYRKGDARREHRSEYRDADDRHEYYEYHSDSADWRSERTEDDWQREEQDYYYRTDPRRGEFRRARSRARAFADRSPKVTHSLIGNLYLTGPRWELTDMDIWHGIGDVKIDLSRAFVHEGETVVIVNGWIGDIDIFVPYDLDMAVSCHVNIGDINVFGNEDGGLNRSVTIETADYQTSTRRVRIVINLIIGDVDVIYV